MDAFGAGNFLLHTPVLSDKAYRRLYTVSRRNALERNRRNARLCPPWEGSDPGDGWERLWGPGASLSCMENLAGPRAALPTLPESKVGRPSADGRNAL